MGGRAVRAPSDDFLPLFPQLYLFTLFSHTALWQNIYMSDFPEFEHDEDVLTEGDEKLEKPPLYKVILHNDNFTTMEFVVFVLNKVFMRTEAEAFAIMLKVHNEGIGVAGTYSQEIATMKAEKAMNLARAQEFPFLCTVEEE
jgi:ATP-dependent Clp protease adaptor protein ClpS